MQRAPQSLPCIYIYFVTLRTFFLGLLYIPPSIPHFIPDIHSNKFIMASDGSVQTPNSSFAWVIFSTKSETHWSSHNTIAKGHTDFSSFHTEVCRYLGVLCTLDALHQAFLPPINSSVYTTIHIDNLGVVCRPSNTPFSIQQCLLLDWDIFNETMEVQHSIPGVIKVQHVKSHQDYDTNTLGTPPLQARLNILADAGTHQAYIGSPIFCQALFYPSHQWSWLSTAAMLHPTMSHLPLWPITHLSCQVTSKKSTAGQKKPFYQSTD